jgi:hypothetical protein
MSHLLAASSPKEIFEKNGDIKITKQFIPLREWEHTA